MNRIKLDIQRFATTGTSLTPANEDGTTFYLYWRRTSYSIEDNTSRIHWVLAINAAYTYYTNAVQVGAVVINGETVYGGGTFSNISRGEHALTSGTLTIEHNNDGTKSFDTSISGWTWGCSWVSKSDTFTLDTIPRYTSTTTLSVASKTETSITLNWRTTDTVSAIKYGIDTSDPTTESDLNTTSGTITIDNLTANQSYTLYFMPQRKDSGLWGDGSSNTWKSLENQSTYNYPNCTLAPSFTIGDSLTLQFYNPLNRTFAIRLWSEESQDYISSSINVSGTSYTFTPDATTLYNSIPNAKSSVYKVYSTYNGNQIIQTGGSYSVNEETNKPTFSNYSYADVNTTTTALTGNNQIIIPNYSNVVATISTVDRAIAQNGASMVRYNLVIGNKTASNDYSSSSSVSIRIDNAPSNVLMLYAEDSRGLTTLVSKTATVKNYTTIQKGTINLTRANDVGTNTTLTYNGTLWGESFGSVSNTAKRATYRFKKTTDSTWTTGTTTITPTTSGNNYTFNGLIAGDLGNNGFSAEYSFNIEVEVFDELSSTLFSFVLGTGIPTIAIAEDGVSINAPYDDSLDSGLQVSGKIYLNGEELSGGGGVDIPQQDDPPSNPEEDDLWIDTDEAGATMLIDGAVSTTSTNPIQNQAITNFVKGTVIYDGGTTGTSGNITLTDDWDKYSYIEIFYSRSEYEIMSTKAPTDLANSECLPMQGLCCYYGYGSGFWIGWKMFKFMQNNKKNVVVEYGNMYTTGSGVIPQTDTTNTIKVYKVIGYK